MDTSETYAKMCEKAKEIQALAYRAQRKEKWSGEWVYRGAIWLPRQDQLQEMLDSGGVFAERIIRLENFFVSYDWGFLEGRLPTWEQLWLTFVMAEKYNKVWNGKDWIERR